MREEGFEMQNTMNQALTQSPLYFDPDNKDVCFPELMPIFHNRFLSFPAGSQFDRFPEIEGRMPGEVYSDRPAGFEILKDSAVRLTCYAPGAKRVTVMEKEWKEPLPLQECKEGYWTGEIAKIRPGFHYQDYYADGNQILNLLMPIGYSDFRPVNYYEVPGQGDDFFYLKDVPHGTIHMEHYFSNVLGEERVCYVYTPPSYRKDLTRRYPVLYLQHGFGESETAWIWQGRVNYIADNLFHEKDIDEAVIVMNNGYAGNPFGSQQNRWTGFLEMLVQDCIPFIDRKYRTVSNKQGRAVAGDAMLCHGASVCGACFDRMRIFNILPECEDDALHRQSVKADGIHEWDIKRNGLKHFLTALSS